MSLTTAANYTFPSHHITEKKVCQPKSKRVGAKTESSPPEVPSKRPTRSRRNTSNLTPSKRSLSPSISESNDKDDAYVDDEDGDKESDDEDFEVEDEPKPKKKKKTGNSPKPKKKRKSAPAAVSSSSTTASNKSYSKKFCKLKKGAKFITMFGVVEVVADDRLPTDCHKSTIDEKIIRGYMKRKGRFHDRETKVRDKIAVGGRSRREELKNIYIESQCTSKSASAAQQKKVWELYCPNITPGAILKDGLSLACKVDSNLGKKVEVFDEEDPRCPKDHYPDRIVECNLIKDERVVFVRKPSEYNFHAKEEEEEDDGDETGQKKTVPMKLFIARRDLTREYGPSMSSFVCSECGKEYSFREGLKYHLSNGVCANATKKAGAKETRDEQIVAIGSKASSDTGSRNTLLTSLHGPIKVRDERKSIDRPPGFGNPHKIKEFKKHKMPPWLVFNDERSSMYPEIYAALEFRRGSQNRNHYNKIKEEDGYIPRSEKHREAKRLRKLRMKDPYSTVTSLYTQLATADDPTSSGGKILTLNQPIGTPAGTSCPARGNRKKKKEPTKKKQSTKKKPNSDLPDLPTEPPTLPPLPTIGNPDAMDIDFGYDGGNDDLIFDACLNPISLGGTSSIDMISAQENFNTETKAPVAAVVAATSSTAATTSATSNNKSNASTSKKKRKKGITINKKKDCVVIDTQVLATECEGGRYPTVNRYYGEHEAQCIVCKKADDTPLIHCDFCKNSVHQLCIDKRMLNKDPQVVIRENEPDDTPMCHDCISTCLFRRSRAENRRLSKWQHELSKAGLGSVPDAAGLAEEVHLNVANQAGNDNEDGPTYKPCPDGGPGGLICCSYCTASYSRFLSNTAKEMEAQSVSRVGQEVSEILELLADAKQRLQGASDVSQSNDNRRGLLDANQSAHSGMSTA